MIGIIGKKLGMTQIFNEQGQQIPCTVVEAPPNPVVQVLAAETAGVQSVQLGYGEQKLARIARPDAGSERGGIERERHRGDRGAHESGSNPKRLRHGREGLSETFEAERESGPPRQDSCSRFVAVSDQYDE